MNRQISNNLRPRHRAISRKSFILSAIILVVLWVGLTAAWNTRKMQMRMKCSANLKKIGMALTEYAAEFHESAPSLSTLIQHGLLNHGDLTCPSSKAPNYVYLFELRRDAGSVDEEWVYEPVLNHGDGANVLFQDGRCNFVPRDQLLKRAVSAD